MDQLLAIRVFSRVVEAGNFTKAADSLRMPKATVSKLVQTLEAHLGVQLLQRTTRRVAVTPDGAAYFEKGARVVKELEDIDASFSAARLRPRGHLRVDLGSSVASRLLVPALPDFLARYPEIRMDLGVSDREIDLIGDNVDCVIHTSVGAEQLKSPTPSTSRTPSWSTGDTRRAGTKPCENRKVRSCVPWWMNLEPRWSGLPWPREGKDGSGALRRRRPFATLGSSLRRNSPAEASDRETVRAQLPPPDEEERVTA
jgi:DNA-binding transcriptional LysR family regulator